MLPTLAYEGEVVVEDRFSHRFNFRQLARGDLLVLESPLEPGRSICKRLMGIPGDIICVDPTGLKAPSTEHIKVPKGHVWIVGDNAEWSRDSRDYGPVSMSLIRSRLIARVGAPVIFHVASQLSLLADMAPTRCHDIPEPY